MSAAFRRRPNKLLTPASARVVRVADGGTVPIIGMCTARVSIAGRHTPVLFTVIAHCPHDLILGLNFFSAHSALIDCSFSTLHFELPMLAEPSDAPHCRLRPTGFLRLQPHSIAYIELSSFPPIPDGEYLVTLLPNIPIRVLHLLVVTAFFTTRWHVFLGWMHASIPAFASAALSIVTALAAAAVTGWDSAPGVLAKCFAELFVQYLRAENRTLSAAAHGQLLVVGAGGRSDDLRTVLTDCRANVEAVLRMVGAAQGLLGTLLLLSFGANMGVVCAVLYSLTDSSTPTGLLMSGILYSSLNFADALDVAFASESLANEIVLSLTVPARIPDGSTRVTTARLYGVCAPRLLHYVDAWTAPPPSSTTTAYIRSSSYADHFSGHVSGPPVNTMSNPFLLFAQIVLSLTVPARIPDGSTRVTTARLYGVCAPRLLHYVDAWTAPPPSSTTTAYIRSSSYADHFSGHVSGPPVNTMSNPFLLFAQVSNNYSSVKTSNRCLVLLACPKSACAVYLYVQDILVSLLVLCGDVEVNPGPSTGELLLQLLGGQKSMQERLDAIEAKLKQVEESAAIVKEVGTRIADMERTIKTLEKKLVDIEDRSRRNNLIVFGIPERRDETSTSLMEDVVDGLFKTTLGVQVSSVERIHRIGRKKADKPRPVILKLIDHREKVNVLQNCFKLKKEKNISVGEDFSAATRQVRKYLWDNTADIRRQGGKVKLIYDKVRIDNEMFQWDSNQTKIVPIVARSLASQMT
ncbi:uncharacterized protein [Dermacentor albipictus]|uniref:uncharacterized protein n=1 Tax=Dermacentor albipictus TaxID=60249 RepID=UPI0038FBEAEA